MNEQPDGIWPVYEVFYIESMLFNTRHAANSIGYLIKVMNELERNDDHEAVEKLDQERILNHVQNIILQGAALSRYFWPVRKAHETRGAALRKALSVSDNSPLENRNLRNALEHFDERIDKYLAKGIVGYVFPRYVGPSLEKDGVPAHIFRAYYLDTGTFEVLGESFEIEGLAQEIIRIHKLLISSSDKGGRLGAPST